MPFILFIQQIKQKGDVQYGQQGFKNGTLE